MARYTGPITRKSRRLRTDLVGGSQAFEKRPYPPGQHGRARGQRRVERAGQRCVNWRHEESIACSMHSLQGRVRRPPSSRSVRRVRRMAVACSKAFVMMSRTDAEEARLEHERHGAFEAEDSQRNRPRSWRKPPSWCRVRPKATRARSSAPARECETVS